MAVIRGLQPPPFEQAIASAGSPLMPDVWHRFLLRVQDQIKNGLAPADAPFVTTTADGALTAATNLGLLTTGYLKTTTALGVATISSVATIPATEGGTGLAVYAVGDLLTAPTTTTLARLADIATGNVLLSGGVGVIPAWGKVDLTTHVTGTLGVGHGGTGTATTFTAGSVVFAGASGIYAQDNANLFWDDTNNRLGLGTVAPTYDFDLIKTVAGPLGARIKNLSTAGGNVHASIIVENSSSYGQLFKAGTAYVGYKNIAAGDLGFFNITAGNISVLNDAGNINFAANGASTPQFTLSTVGIVTSVNTPIGVGVSSPTAFLHLHAGSTVAGTAPLKLNSGTLMTTAEAGAIEFLTDAFYGTITTGAARKTFAFTDGTIANATNAANAAVTDDTTTNATMYPVWVTANTGNLPLKVSSTKLSFNPLSGVVTAKGLTVSDTTTNLVISFKNTTAAGAGQGDVNLFIDKAADGNSNSFTFRTGGADRWQFGTGIIAVDDNFRIRQGVNGATVITAEFTGAVDNTLYLKAGNVGLLNTGPTARLHLPAGTATANTAPLKFIAGTNLTTPEIGALEFTDDGTTAHLYATVRIATIVTRVQLA